MQLAPNFAFDNSAFLNINCDGCGRRLPRDAALATTPAGDDFCEPCGREKGLWETPDNARVVHFDVRMGEYMQQREANGENQRDAERLLAALGGVAWPEPQVQQVQEAAPGVPPMAPQRQAAD